MGRRETTYIAGHHTIIMLHNESRNFTNPRESFFTITTCKVEIVSFYSQPTSGPSAIQSIRMKIIVIQNIFLD